MVHKGAILIALRPAKAASPNLWRSQPIENNAEFLLKLVEKALLAPERQIKDGIPGVIEKRIAVGRYVMKQRLEFRPVLRQNFATGIQIEQDVARVEPAHVFQDQEGLPDPVAPAARVALDEGSVLRKNRIFREERVRGFSKHVVEYPRRFGLRFQAPGSIRPRLATPEGEKDCFSGP